MTITSTFYDTIPGQGVNEMEWAHSAASRGYDYGVVDIDDLRLTAHPTTPYAVVLSPGKFFGHGVWDESDASVTVQCDTVATGATRWDLIAAHRDWTPTGGGPTALVKVNGTSSRAIPVTRANTPGEVDDQPLWLVQWASGQPQPVAIIDLRCWAGNGGMVAADLLALNYLGRPGANVLIGGTTWRFALGANNVWGWADSGNGVLTYGFVQPAGWSLSGECRVSKAGALLRVEVDVTVKRTGANIGITTDFSDIGAVLANAVRGDSGDVKYLPIAVSGGTGNNGTIAMAYVNTTTGKIGFRSAIGTTFSWTSGAVATLNFTYFI